MKKRISVLLTLVLLLLIPSLTSNAAALHKPKVENVLFDKSGTIYQTGDIFTFSFEIVDNLAEPTKIYFRGNSTIMESIGNIGISSGCVEIENNNNTWKYSGLSDCFDFESTNYPLVIKEGNKYTVSLLVSNDGMTKAIQGTDLFVTVDGYEIRIEDLNCNLYFSNKCANGDHIYFDDTEKTIDVEATCKHSGSMSNKCVICNSIIEETKEEIPQLKHNIQHYGAVEPTLNSKGNIEYWWCSICDSIYADAECKNEILYKDTQIAELKDIAKCSIATINAQKYTGSAIKPNIVVKNGNTVLENRTDYTLTYKNNINPGTGIVIIKGKGKYAGEIQKKFTITAPVLKYRAYVQKNNWMDWSTAIISGTKPSPMAGTTDNLRMETIQMKLSGISGYIEYRAYVEKIGWTQWASTKKSTTYAGTKGQSKRIEMIQLKPYGELANDFDVYYRAYSENFGWLGWACNGEKAGSAGYGRKLEAFQINLVKKGDRFTIMSPKAKCFYDKTKDGANPD